MQKFKTKTGYCYLRDSRLILTRGDASSTSIKKSSVTSWWIVGFQLAIGLVLIPDIYLICQAKGYFLGIFMGLISVLLLYSSLKFIFGSYSITPVIKKSSVSAVKFYQGIQGITRSRFKVTYTNSKGNKRHRVIMMPGTLNGGGREVNEAALKMMNEWLR